MIALNQTKLQSQEGFKGGAYRLRKDPQYKCSTFQLITKYPEKCFEVKYNPRKFKIEHGREYVFEVDVLHPFYKGGTTSYVLKGIIPL